MDNVKKFTAFVLHGRFAIRFLDQKSIRDCPFPYSLKQQFRGVAIHAMNTWSFPPEKEPKVRAFLEGRGYVDSKEAAREAVPNEQIELPL